MTIPNHILLIALDLRHRYGASALELSLQRVDSYLENGEIAEAREWTQVATVLARALRPDADPLQPTPL